MKKSPKEYRFADNPEEQKFFELASKSFAQGYINIHKSLGYIIHGVDAGTHYPKKYATEEEVHTFLMTIQWLGSPVGQGFLRDAGYVKKEVEEKEVPLQV